MLAVAEIADGVKEVAADYPVERIELFGSYAQNRATDNSDVDLLVEFTSLAVSLLTLSSFGEIWRTGSVSRSILFIFPCPRGLFSMWARR